MSVRLSGEELGALDGAIDHALVTGDESGIDVLGYGEISTVVSFHRSCGKEGHRQLLPSLLSRINGGPFARSAISLREVDRYYESDAYLWEFLQRLRRADRFWQRRVRRRTYQFLLPGRIERNV